MTWGKLELDARLVKLIADGNPYLFELESEILGHSTKDIRTEFNIGMRAELPMLANAETGSVRDSRFLGDEQAQGEDSWIIVLKPAVDVT